MKMKLIFKFQLACWIFLLVFTSCTNIDLSNISNDVVIDESLVVPIGSGSANIKDILDRFVNNDNIVIDADTINYVSNFTYSYSFKDVIVPASATSTPIQLPLTTAVIPANTTIPITGGNAFQVNLGLDPVSTTQRVDSVYINSATIAVNVTLTNLPTLVPSDLKITLQFPKMVNQGTRTVVSVPVNIVNFNQSVNLVLNNIIINTDGLTGIPVDVILKSGNRSITTNATSKINIGLTLSPVNFKVAYGLFQPSTLASTNIKIPLDMLKSLPTGLQFANPKAFINIQSNIGSWLDYNIDYVRAYTKNKSVIKNASFNGIASAFEIINKKPTVPGTDISWDLKPLDKNYGATNLLFETIDQLDTLEYKFSLSADPSSPAPSFVTPGMKMTANVKIQIPMYLEKASTFNYTDTIQNGSVNTNNSVSLNDIEQGILVLKVTNGLPAKATFTIKLLDINKHIINSTLNDSIYTINSGNVGNNGIVTSPATTSLNINLTNAQMTDLKNAKFFAYNILLKGQDATKEIQFTRNDLITVKLGVFVKVSKTTTIGNNN